MIEGMANSAGSLSEVWPYTMAEQTQLKLEERREGVVREELEGVGGVGVESRNISESNRQPEVKEAHK